MRLVDELRRLGLPQKEAQVYLALLSAGTASAQGIARLAGLVRPTTYVILQSLAKKGLVSQVTDPGAKKMTFMVEPPGRLERYLELQQADIERRREDLEKLLPELISAYGGGEERPRVRLFEGKEGLGFLQQEFIAASKGPIVGMAPEDELRALFPPEEYNRAIRSVRVQAGIPSRHIYVSSQPSDTMEREAAVMLRESRHFPSAKLPIRASFAAHGPLLSVVTFRNKIIGVLIEHQDIADSFRAIFESLWETAVAYQAKPLKDSTIVTPHRRESAQGEMPRAG